MKLYIALFGFILSGCASLVHRDMGCDRFQLRLETMDRFCTGMANDVSEAQCGGISKEVLQECIAIYRLKALDQCYNLVSKKEIEKLYQETCVFDLPDNTWLSDSD